MIYSQIMKYYQRFLCTSTFLSSLEHCWMEGKGEVSELAADRIECRVNLGESEK